MLCLLARFVTETLFEHEIKMKRLGLWELLECIYITIHHHHINRCIVSLDSSTSHQQTWLYISPLGSLFDLTTADDEASVLEVTDPIDGRKCHTVPDICIDSSYTTSLWSSVHVGSNQCAHQLTFFIQEGGGRKKVPFRQLFQWQ